MGERGVSWAVSYRAMGVVSEDFTARLNLSSVNLATH